MKLHLHKTTPVRLPRKQLQRLFEGLTAREGRGKGGINIVFAGDRDLQRLNAQYRHRDHATDVLSFNLDDDAGDGEIFGEIYISVPTAQRQAAEYGGTLGGELLRLTCHGLLHLFGYDHHKRADTERMREREAQYLAMAEEA